MVRIISGLVLVILCGLSLTNVSATPSTQIWIPSTDIQGFNNLHVGWDVYLSQKGKGTLSNGGLTIGILPFEKIKAEVGVDYRDISGDHWHPLYLNAKIGVPEGALGTAMPAMALGIYDLGFTEGVTDYNLSYALAAKTVKGLGRFSGGVYLALGDTALMMNRDGEKEPFGILASWDRTISEISDKLWTAVDFQSGTNGYGAVSFGAAWSFAPNASLILGYDYFLNADAYPGTITLQVDLNVK